MSALPFVDTSTLPKRTYTIRIVELPSGMFEWELQNIGDRVLARSATYYPRRVSAVRSASAFLKAIGEGYFQLIR